MNNPSPLFDICRDWCFRLHDWIPSVYQEIIVGNSLPNNLKIDIRQVLHPQMHVPSQHLKSFVTCDGFDLHRIKTLLKKPAGGLMSEIVEG